jgi:lipoate-protein ligase A
MRAHGGAILQHGAILLDWDGRLQAGAMGLDDDGGLRPHITTLIEQLGTEVLRADLERSITRAFAEELGIELEPGKFSGRERAREEQLETDSSITG